MKNLKKYFFLAVLLFSIVPSQTKFDNFKRPGIEHMRNGRFKEAITIFNKLIASYPQNAEGYNLRGLCYEKQERYEYAVLDFRRAIALATKKTDYKKNLDRVIKVWYAKLDSKIEGHKRNLAIDPNNAFDYLEIGQSHRWKEEWNKAETWYDEYLQRDDNASPDEIIRFSIILAHTKHIAKGEKILEKWVDRYPDDWRLWSRYGYFTMWMGRYKNAENAFLQALKFKPFFKEAEDGLDLARRQGYLTQYEPREFEKEYPIDSYYLRLKRNPDNKQIRYSLINELINVGRFPEAKDQLDLMSRTSKNEEKFKELKAKYEKELEEKYNSEIDENLRKLSENPNDSSAIYIIAERMISLAKYEDADEILTEYLELQPLDNEANYLKAVTLSSMEQNNEAHEYITKTMENGGNKLKYKLLAAQLNVWTLKDLTTAKKLFDEVLQIQPNNMNAINGKALIYYSENNPDSADIYIKMGKQIDEKNPDLVELESMNELLKLRIEQEKYIVLINQADSLLRKGECGAALEKYNQYVAKMPFNLFVYQAMAEAQICLNDYEGAIESFDTILQKEYSYEIEKKRAKTIFWSGDSADATGDFEKLIEKDSTDSEVLVFLGDSYARRKEYLRAKDTYISVPDSLWDYYQIDTRLGWLPIDVYQNEWWYGPTLQFQNYFFSYLNLFGNAYYFSDNLNFTNAYSTIGAETSLTSFLNIGASWKFGLISDGLIEKYYDRPMISLGIYSTQNIIFSVGLGKLLFDYQTKYEWEVSAKYNYQNKGEFTLSFFESDGALVLYSPYLVQNRITAQLYRFEWETIFKEKIILRGFWNWIRAMDNPYFDENWGNEFQFRIGRKFLPNVIVGYEFDFIDFQYTTAYFYSPQNFTSHSIWSDWTIFRDKELYVHFDGKIGFVPISSYIIWDGMLEAEYKPYENLFLTGFAFFRQSQRYEIGYQSKAIGFSVRWNPFY